MKHRISRLMAVLLVGLAGLTSLPRDANAVPELQLGIVGGIYDWTTETVISTSPSFSLYAFLKPGTDNPLSDMYYVSMAVTPKISTPTNLGSFTYNGHVVNATSDMTYGIPPVNAVFPDIPKHGMFPTYYKEVAFSFASGNQSGVFNTQYHPTWGPQTGSGMYYNRFDINTSNLGAGYAIHFDLYNTNLEATCKKRTCTYEYETEFAPFSHDAQSMTSPPPVPEPETYAMLLAGLGLLGFSARRRVGG